MEVSDAESKEPLTMASSLSATTSPPWGTSHGSSASVQQPPRACPTARSPQSAPSGSTLGTSMTSGSRTGRHPSLLNGPWVSGTPEAAFACVWLRLSRREVHNCNMEPNPPCTAFSYASVAMAASCTPTPVRSHTVICDFAVRPGCRPDVRSPSSTIS